MPLRGCLHDSQLGVSGSSAAVRRLSRAGTAACRPHPVDQWRDGQVAQHPAVRVAGPGVLVPWPRTPRRCLGGEPGMFPEQAGDAVVQDVAPDGQMVGIGLIQQPPDQFAPDAGAAELRQERDVDDEDLVVGVVDDEPSGRLAAGADDRVDGVGEGFPVVAVWASNCMRVNASRCSAGQPSPSVPAGGRVHGQQEVAVVWETLGTGADFGVHERGILARAVPPG